MTTEKLVLSILTNKAADAKALFEQIMVSKVEALTEARIPQVAEAMLDEETEQAVNYFNDVHSYFNAMLEEGASVDDAVNALMEDEDVGPELTEKYLELLSSYLNEEGPEDPEEDEDCEEDDSDEEEVPDDAHKEPLP